MAVAYSSGRHRPLQSRNGELRLRHVLRIFEDGELPRNAFRRMHREESRGRYASESRVSAPTLAFRIDNLTASARRISDRGLCRLPTKAGQIRKAQEHSSGIQLEAGQRKPRAPLARTNGAKTETKPGLDPPAQSPRRDSLGGQGNAERPALRVCN